MLYFCDTGNFGDDLNGWLWSRLAPELMDERADRLFVGIGTILSPEVPQDPQKFVFGSGWSGEKAPGIDGKWKIFGVRGPLTAEGLGLASDSVLSDPALLVRKVYPTSPVSDRPIGFMPHHRSVPLVDWANLCREHGFCFINPEDAVETVLGQIASCRTLLAEAMHGAILADAFRIPWIPVRAYSHINEFKWRDWCASLGLDFDPVRVSPIFARGPRGGRKVETLWKRALAPTPLGKDKWKRLPLRKSRPEENKRFMELLANLAKNRAGTLSRKDRSEEAETRQLAALDRLRTDWASS